MSLAVKGETIIKKNAQNIHSLIEEVSDQIVIERLSSTKDSDEGEGEESTSKEKETPLQLIWKLMSRSVSRLSGNSEVDKQSLLELVDWTVKNWATCKEVTSAGKVVDICKCPSNEDGLISLHELIQDGGKSQNAIATLIMFDKKGCKMSPSSKIEFYSDPK